VLSALRRLARRALADPDQLALSLVAPPRSAADLLARLTALGLTGIDRCTLTRNRTVMVSVRAGELRVHAGYLAAPDDVLLAIVTFACGRRRVDRRRAQRVILDFDVPRTPGARRAERTHPDDEPQSARLTSEHGRLNAGHFGGALRAIPVRVSRRMRSRLGHYSPAPKSPPVADGAESDGPPGQATAEIAISRRHIVRHGWNEALATLLHEMVHQWQDETGRPIDHGRDFRARARAVGIAPRSGREVGPRRPGV
jgi:hypothetical protein